MFLRFVDTFKTLLGHYGRFSMIFFFNFKKAESHLIWAELEHISSESFMFFGQFEVKIIGKSDPTFDR